MDLTQVALVLCLDLFNLIICIIQNLLHSFVVLLLQLLDLSSQLFDVIVLDLHEFVVVVLFFCHFLALPFEKLQPCLSKPSGFLILDSLQLLVLGCILQHLLRVLVTTGFQLLVVVFHLRLNLLLEVLFQLLRIRSEQVKLITSLQLSAGQLLLQLHDFVFLLVSAHLLIYAGVGRVLVGLELTFQALFLSMIFLHLSFSSENLLREGLNGSRFFVLGREADTTRLSVFDVHNEDGAVLAC